MFKGGLVESMKAALTVHGYEHVSCMGSRSSFDIIAKNGKNTFLRKALANVEGLSRERAEELKSLSTILSAIPIVVSERMKNSLLADDVVYDRYGVYVTNLPTFTELLGEIKPKVHSRRGSYCVHINGQLLSDQRRLHGLTQEQLAKIIGVTKQSIYRYENGSTISLDIFDRLTKLFGDTFAEKDFKLSIQHSSHELKDGQNLTYFKKLVKKEFEGLGFNTEITNAPFDLIAMERQRIFSVVSNDWRRLEQKIEKLDELRELLGGYIVCISDRKVKTEINVLNPQELSEIESAKELFKLLSQK